MYAIITKFGSNKIFSEKLKVNSKLVTYTSNRSENNSFGILFNLWFSFNDISSFGAVAFLCSSSYNSSMGDTSGFGGFGFDALLSSKKIDII